jgi:hypothetical protein
MFSIVGFLASQILGIVGLQIEIQRMFFLARLRRHRLQPKNLNFLIFVSKNLVKLELDVYCLLI